MVPNIGREMKQKRKSSTKDSRHCGSRGLMAADLSYFVSLVATSNEKTPLNDKMSLNVRLMI